MTTYLVSCADEVCLWSVNRSSDETSLSHVFTRSPHTGPITGAAFNHKGECFYTCSTDGRINLIDVLNGEILKTIPGPDDPSGNQPMNCLALTQGARWIITGANEPNRSITTTTDVNQSINQYCLSLWDIKKFKRLSKPLLGHYAPVTCLALSIRQTPVLHVASGDEQGKILIHQLNSESVTHLNQDNKNAIRSINYMQHAENKLISGGDDCSVHVWDVNQSTLTHQFNTQHLHNRPITAVLSSPVNQSVIISTSRSGSIKQHDMRQRLLVFELKAGESVNCADWCDDGILIAFGTSSVSGKSGSVKLCDVRMIDGLNSSNRFIDSGVATHHSSVRAVKFTHVTKKTISQSTTNQSNSQSSQQPLNQPVNQSINQTPSLRHFVSPDAPNSQPAPIRSSSSSSVRQAVSQSIDQSEFKSPQSGRPSNSQSTEQSIDDRMAQLALDAPVTAQKQQVRHPSNQSINQPNNQSLNVFEPITPYVPHSKSVLNPSVNPQPINRSISQALNQSVSQPLYHSINQSLNQPINHQPMDQYINQPINQPINPASLQNFSTESIDQPNNINRSQFRSINQLSSQGSSQSISQLSNQFVNHSNHQACNQSYMENPSINHPISGYKAFNEDQLAQSLKAVIDSKMIDFLSVFRGDMKDMHLDMIKQFTFQSNDAQLINQSMMESMNSMQQSMKIMRQSMEELRKENAELRDLVESISQSINP